MTVSTPTRPRVVGVVIGTDGRLQTSVSLQTSNILFDFAVNLASAARLFTTAQLARHPDLSWRTRPQTRAQEFLHAHRDTFERLPAQVGECHRYRLTRAPRARYGITWRAVSGKTQRAYHWLGLGDIWCEMAFSHGRPTEWRTEVDAQFDVICMWRGVTWCIEYQRTPITEKKWQAKWDARKTWYKAQKWEGRPRILLVDATGQQDGTIGLPRGTLHVRGVEEIRHL